MKIKLSILFFFFIVNVNGQEYVKSITTKRYVRPKISSTASLADGVNIVLDALKAYSELKCLDKINESLELKLPEAQEKYKGKIPEGKSIKLMVLVNKSTCKVINIIHATQTIRIRDGQCSVDDIKLEAPDLLIDSNIGYFVILMKF